MRPAPGVPDDPATTPIPRVGTRPGGRPGATTAWRASVAACLALVLLTAAGVGGLWWYRVHPVGNPGPAWSAPAPVVPLATVGATAGPASTASSTGRASASAARSTARSPASTTTDQVAGLAGYAGTWDAHGIEIALDARGHGTMTFRTYTPCDQPSPGVPCEPVGTIDDTGRATVQLQRSAAGALAMRIVTSNDQPDWPTGKVLPLRARQSGVLQVGTGDQTWGLCLPPAYDPICGA